MPNNYPNKFRGGCGPISVADRTARTPLRELTPQCRHGGARHVAKKTNTSTGLIRRFSPIYLRKVFFLQKLTCSCIEHNAGKLDRISIIKNARFAGKRSFIIETISPLLTLVRKLSGCAVLSEQDKSAVCALPYVTRSYRSTAYIMREGDKFEDGCSFVLSGIACRQKHTMQGKRQIVSLHLAGDLLDFQPLSLRRSDHNIQALTSVKTVEIDRMALHALALRYPAVANAMWMSTLIDAAILREWVTNVGRRDARGRVAHLLCEYAARMTAGEVDKTRQLILPMTHEQIGDATGLTSVHVCRTLKLLADDGVVTRDGSHIDLAGWKKMREVGEFSALYLHLDEMQGAA